MSSNAVRQTLETLLDLLRQERQAAQQLDMGALETVVEAKRELLTGLSLEQDDVVGMEDLLKQIDHENRRNAFLLWTGLNWVRDLMGFFGKAAMPQVYGGSGQSRTLHQGGRLLSGKV